MDFNNENEAIPDELLDKLLNLDEAFKNLSTVLKPLSTLDINSSDCQLNPLDRANLNLVCGCALNSLFWMYLRTLGIDPKEHKIKHQLDKFKEVKLQLDEISRKDKAPVLDKGAARRFVRNALWEPRGSTSVASSSKEHAVQNRRMKRKPFAPLKKV